MPRNVPRMTTDAEAEAFLDQDLSDLDFDQFKPAPFEFAKKSARVSMRLPEGLLAAVKAEASRRKSKVLQPLMLSFLLILPHDTGV